MTVRNVLAQANLGTRAFYRHFASKDELVLAMCTGAAAPPPPPAGGSPVQLGR
jgi:AcrR family transcriptional regulator